MAEEGRQPLYAELTGESYRAWQRFAAHHGCSIVALLEAVGLEIIDGDWVAIPLHKMEPGAQRIIVAAREITAERRRRS